MAANEMFNTYLEDRYVDRAKLDALLQSLFGQSYSVVVCASIIRPTDIRSCVPDLSRYGLHRGA